MLRPKNKSCLFPVTLPEKFLFKKIPTLKFFQLSRLQIIKKHAYYTHFEQKKKKKKNQTYLPYFSSNRYRKQTNKISMPYFHHTTAAAATSDSNYPSLLFITDKLSAALKAWTSFICLLSGIPGELLI